jgi:hypothetical protein
MEVWFTFRKSVVMSLCSVAERWAFLVVKGGVRSVLAAVENERIYCHIAQLSWPGCCIAWSIPTYRISWGMNLFYWSNLLWGRPIEPQSPNYVDCGDLVAIGLDSTKPLTNKSRLMNPQELTRSFKLFSSATYRHTTSSSTRWSIGQQIIIGGKVIILFCCPKKSFS